MSQLIRPHGGELKDLYLGAEEADAAKQTARDLMSWAILPDEPIAHEGRRGVIRARAEDTVRTLQEGGAER